MKARCINAGLSRLEIIFNELQVQDEVSQNVGISLRRVLHPISVLFELSPSVIIRDRSESTSKFAVTASMVKVKPIQKNGELGFDSLVKDTRTIF